MNRAFFCHFSITEEKITPEGYLESEAVMDQVLSVSVYAESSL